MGSPKNRRQTNGGGSVYRWGDEEFPSVTTIIGGGVPKPALVNWAAKSAAEFAVNNRSEWLAMAEREPQAAIDTIKKAPYRDRDSAAAIGSMLHDYAEAEARGDSMAEPAEDVAGHVWQVRRFIQEFQPVYEQSEVSVYNRRHNFAGTLDAILLIDGVRYLIDYKTSRSGIWPETALQLAAYRYGEFMGVGTDEIPMPKVDGALAVHVTAKDYSVIPIVADDDTFSYFLHARKIYDWCRSVGSASVGAPMARKSVA